MELQEKLERLNELNALLNMDEKGSSDCMEEPEEEIPDAERRVSEKRPSILDKLDMFKEQSSKAVPEPMKTKEKAEQVRRSSL